MLLLSRYSLSCKKRDEINRKIIIILGENNETSVMKPCEENEIS